MLDGTFIQSIAFFKFTVRGQQIITCIYLTRGALLLYVTVFNLLVRAHLTLKQLAKAADMLFVVISQVNCNSKSVAWSNSPRQDQSNRDLGFRNLNVKLIFRICSMTVCFMYWKVSRTLYRVELYLTDNSFILLLKLLGRMGMHR